MTEPLPGSAGPLDMAMEAARGDPRPDNPARVLLKKQARLVDAQRANERMGTALKLLTALAGLFVAGVFAAMLMSAVRSEAVVVEAFAIPPALAEQGHTGEVVAAALQDGLQRIQASTRTTAAQRAIANAWTGDIDVEVPSTGVSLAEIEQALRDRFGNDVRIGGALTRNEDRTVTLTVRGDGVEAAGFTGRSSELAALTTRAAEHVYSQAEPALFAHYLYQNRRTDEALAFVREAMSRPMSEVDRASLLNTWGNLLWARNAYEEAAERYREALRLQPRRWGSWRNLVGVTSACCGDEPALQVAAEMRRAAAKAPRRDQPDPAHYGPEMAARADFTGLVAVYEAENRERAGGYLLTTTGPIIGGLEADRHDWSAARSALATADRDDPATEPSLQLVEGRAQLEAGRPAAAVVLLQAAQRAVDADPELRSEVQDVPCWLALALARAGRTAGARATLARAPRQTVCRSLEGMTLEALGDRAAADAAFLSTVADAPSSPFAYQRWGEVLLARGDLAGAARRFAEAHERGPRWADPLKGRGDVLAAQGRPREAAVKYKEALRFAPGWIELRQAHARAVAGSRR